MDATAADDSNCRRHRELISSTTRHKARATKDEITSCNSNADRRWSSRRGPVGDVDAVQTITNSG